MNINLWKSCENYSVLNAKINFFSRLCYQLYVISAFAFRTNFEKYRVAFCWPILSQYIGMHLFSLHAVAANKIWILPKTMNVNITSIIDNWGSKIHLHRVMQLEWHGVRQNLRMFTNVHIYFELRTNKKLTGFYSQYMIIFPRTSRSFSKNAEPAEDTICIFKWWQFLPRNITLFV